MDARVKPAHDATNPGAFVRSPIVGHSSLLTRFFRIASAQPDSEFYIGRGSQRLNDGVVELALNDLSAAIDLAPQHGIALALAAIAAVRAGNRALQQKIIERYCSASKQF